MHRVLLHIVQCGIFQLKLHLYDNCGKYIYLIEKNKFKELYDL